MDSLSWMWLIAFGILLIIEAAVPGLVSIWFALGALVALVCSLLNGALWLQIVWFFVISIAALLFTRPIAKKYLNSRVERTNADAVIGKTCIVSEAIDNVAGCGAVTVGGKVWTARMDDDEKTAEAGQRVEAVKIEGVKLIVKEIKEK